MRNDSRRRCLWAGFAVAAALVLGTGPRIESAVPTGGLERLQHLTRLPQLTFSIGLTFTGTGGFELLAGAEDPARELEEWRKALAGNTSDAPRYARLGKLLAAINETQLSQRAYAQAAEMYEQQGVEDSSDPELLAGYGEVLREQSKPDQAERVLRRAVQVAPENWLAHAALSRCLGASAIHALARAGPGQPGPGLAELLADPGQAKPDAARVEKAQRLMIEAVQEAERSVECGPRKPEAFATRASAGSTRRLLETLLSQFDQAEPDAGRRIVEVNRAIFHHDAVPDLWTAARLGVNDPDAWGCAAMLELLAEGFQRGLRQADELLTRDLWPLMPEKTRTTVREAITALEAIGQNAEPRVAAAALTLLGNLQFFVLRDTVGGEASLRRATVLDPRLQSAWETLTFALVFSRRFDALVEVCQARLKHTDSLRNRVLLAKAYEKSQQPAAMLEEAELAQRRNPENLLANLTLGAALLKTADGDLARARALQFLAKATQLAGEAPAREMAIEVFFQRGLYFALTGQRTVARAHFRQILDLDAEHAEAKEAVQALDQLGE